MLYLVAAPDEDMQRSLPVDGVEMPPDIVKTELLHRLLWHGLIEAVAGELVWVRKEGEVVADRGQQESLGCPASRAPAAYESASPLLLPLWDVKGVGARLPPVVQRPGDGLVTETVGDGQTDVEAGRSHVEDILVQRNALLLYIIVEREVWQCRAWRKRISDAIRPFAIQLYS